MTLTAATAVKVSVKELDEVARHLAVAPDAEALFRLAPRLEWLCVTRGEAGAALFGRAGTSWERGAPSVEVVNTVGAGDSFTAGLTEGLVSELAPEDVLQLAQRRAASILTKKGGLPDAG